MTPFTYIEYINYTNIGTLGAGHCHRACRLQWFLWVPLKVSETAPPFTWSCKPRVPWHIRANEKPKEKLVQHYKTHGHHFEKHKSIFRLHVQHFKRQVQHFPKCCTCRVEMLLCFFECCECVPQMARTAFRKHLVTPTPMT